MRKPIESFYHYLMTRRNAKSYSPIAEFAKNAFYDDDFPKQSKDYDEISKYLEEMGYDLVGMGFIKADKYINDNEKNDNDKNSEGYSWDKWYNANGELEDAEIDICYTGYSNGDYIEREDGEETQSGEQKNPIKENRVKSWPIKWYLRRKSDFNGNKRK